MKKLIAVVNLSTISAKAQVNVSVVKSVITWTFGKAIANKIRFETAFTSDANPMYGYKK